MHRLLRKYRYLIRRLACVAALALCFGAVLTSHHWHDEECAEEHICAVCVFSDSSGAFGVSTPQAWNQWVRLPDGLAVVAFFPASRPFEAPLIRAPPNS